MALYRKKPVVIEAEIYKPGMEDGFKCILDYNPFRCIFDEETLKCETCKNKVPVINTLEGEHIISEGDYIITGVKGERYPCKPDIFEMTYEEVK